MALAAKARLSAATGSHRLQAVGVFTAVLGDFRKIKQPAWKLVPIRARLRRGEAKNAAKEKKHWTLTLGPTPAVADAVKNLLAAESVPWLGKALQARLARALKRLSRPVMAGLQAWDPELVIADEAHRLKEDSAARTRAVRELSAGRRAILLTGTPLRNHAVDGKALLEVILPERTWTVMGRSGKQVVPVVKELLARRMIRRLKKDVLTELPPKLRQRVPVRLEAAHLIGYVAAMHEAEVVYGRTLVRTGSSSKARRAALGQWSIARKELGLAKLKSGAPSALIADVIAAKKRAIVFAHHHDVLDGLEQKLTEAGMKVGRVDGGTRQGARAETVRLFQEGGIDVFLGGIHAAGEAITLTRAETVVFVELDWVPGVLLQAEDRGHRAGQTASSYHIIHLTAEFVPPEKVTPVPEPFSLAEALPKDFRRYEKTVIASPELQTAMTNLEEDLVRWDEYRAAKEEAERLESVENIDEYMIAALDSKTRHIDAVLNERSDSLIAETADDDTGAISRLARVTEERIRRRVKR